MILDSFRLNGKAAIVTGASTGMEQGMSLALADAGADVAGVDYVDMPETQGKIEAMGKRSVGVNSTGLYGYK
jgi:2-deoxy-D-gluconate 3-dehydrogenase